MYRWYHAARAHDDLIRNTIYELYIQYIYCSEPSRMIKIFTQRLEMLFKLNAFEKRF